LEKQNTQRKKCAWLLHRVGAEAKGKKDESLRKHALKFQLCTEFFFLSFFFFVAMLRSQT
jgi:hypothetical protein